MLPHFGTLLLLVSPPDDLFESLVSEDISDNKREYEFLITHKYLGNHVVDISFKRLPSMESAENDLKVKFAVENNGKILYANVAGKGWGYWGKNRSGLSFQMYKVPEDLPIRVPLKAKVYIDGDISTFLERYGPAELIIRKSSDE